MQQLSLSLSKTVKKENANFSISPHSEPDAPPGFPAHPPINFASAAAESSINRSSACAVGRVSRVYRRRSFSSEQHSPRRTSRKRSRPQFYTPPPAQPPPPSSRRSRGRPPKAPLMSQSTRPRGRPPKAPFMSQLSRQQTETRNPNQVSSTPSRKAQQQSFIISLQISKEKSSSEKSSSESNSQVIEGGPLVNNSPSPHSSVWPKAIIKRKTHDIEETLETPGKEETLFDISLTEDQPSPSPAIDPKILQHVANALHYMSADDATVKSRSSDINNNLAHTLKAINEKHGDITKGSLLESDCMKTLILLGICKVVQDLQNKSLKDVDVGTLDSYYTTVRDAENMKVNVRWLHDRLDEIKDAVRLTDKAKVLVNEKNRRLENLDIKRKELVLRRGELHRLKSEIQDIEEQMARDVVMVEELNRRIGAQQSRFSKFQHAHLMDGLI